MTERTRKAGGESKGEIKKAEEQPVQQVTPTRALSPFEELDRMFENFVPRGWLRPWRWGQPSFGDLFPFEIQGPRAFVLGTRGINVADELDRWLDPERRYFEVRGDDGDIYILR